MRITRVLAITAISVASAVRRRTVSRAAAAGLAAIVLAACVADGRPSSCDDPIAELDLVLTADALEPADPAVCQDQEVEMTVMPDVSGVLHIHGYDEWVPATPVAAGEETVLTFTAERAGQFPIEFHPEDDPRGEEVGLFTVHEP